MTDSYLPLLQAVISLLDGDTALANLVAERIYTSVPDNEVFPYATVQISSIPYDTKETAGMEHTVQVNCYSRKGAKECGQIRAAVYDVLNRNETGLASAGVVNIQFNGLSQILPDQDGASWFGVVQFRAVILS